MLLSGERKATYYDLTKPQQAKVTFRCQLQEIFLVPSFVLYVVSKEVGKPNKEI